MNFDTAQKLLTNGKTIIKQPNKSIGEFRCFNNNKIDIIGTIQVDITSGSSNANNCTILLVNNNTINIMGRDIMDKLGLTMTTTNKDKKRGLKQPMLNAESIWNIETASEPELDIRFNEDTPDDDSASDNSTLQNGQPEDAKQGETTRAQPRNNNPYG